MLKNYKLLTLCSNNYILWKTCINNNVPWKNVTTYYRNT